MRSIPFDKVAIPISSVGEGISNFTYITVYPDLQAGPGRRFPKEIEVHARVATVIEDFLVDLEVSSQGKFVCDRCGESFEKLIRGKLKMLFTFDSVKAMDGDGVGDEIRLLEPRVTEIDLRQDVIDALILFIPSKMLCKTSCKGICPQCGINLNIMDCSCSINKMDSQWETLKQIKFRDSSPR